MWEREETLNDPDHVASAARRAGLDAAALRAGGPSDAELDALHAQFTQEALTVGRVRRAELRAAVGRDFLGPGPAGAAGAGVEADGVAIPHIVKMRPGLRM